MNESQESAREFTKAVEENRQPELPPAPEYKRIMPSHRDEEGKLSIKHLKDKPKEHEHFAESPWYGCGALQSNPEKTGGELTLTNGKGLQTATFNVHEKFLEACNKNAENTGEFVPSFEGLGPEWRFIAQDKDGDWYAYRALPTPGEEFDSKWRGGGRCKYLGYSPVNGDWKETLMLRSDEE